MAIDGDISARRDEYLTRRGKATISNAEKNKRAVIRRRPGRLAGERIAKFTPIFDEYQAELNRINTSGTNLRNRLWVADYVGMTDEASKSVLDDAFKLRMDRIELLKKYTKKLDKQLPTLKVAQWVQVESTIQVLVDLAAAAEIPIVTKTPNTLK